MRRTLISAVVFLSIIVGRLASAQEVWVLAQAGRSSYGALYFGSLGGGGGDQHWQPGPILGVGARLKTSRSFSLDGTVEYSTHRVDPETWSYPIKGDPHNTIFDINAVARLHFGFIGPMFGSFSFGLGYWFQKRDPVEYDSPVPQFPVGHTASALGFLLGLGLGAHLAERVDLYFDGNLQGREYVTPVLQLGLAYRLH